MASCTASFTGRNPQLFEDSLKAQSPGVSCLWKSSKVIASRQSHGGHEPPRPMHFCRDLGILERGAR